MCRLVCELTLQLVAAGFCPFTEFERTKHDFGLCQNLHDESCKADWGAMDDRDRDRLGYERDLKKWLDKLMVDLKQKIARNETRLAAQEDVVLLPEDQVRTACRVIQTCWLRRAPLGHCCHSELVDRENMPIASQVRYLVYGRRACPSSLTRSRSHWLRLRRWERLAMWTALRHVLLTQSG